MSDDLAQALLCMSFTIPAVALLILVCFRKNLRGGSDTESSATILEEDEPVKESSNLSATGRRVVAFSVWLCLGLVTLVTLITLLVAERGSAATGQCPLGF